MAFIFPLTGRFIFSRAGAATIYIRLEQINLLSECFIPVIYWNVDLEDPALAGHPQTGPDHEEAQDYHSEEG